MMKLFQISLSASDAAQVNKGNTQLPIYKAYCDALMSGDFPGKNYYTHVADLATDDLDYAFEVGNIGPEDLITRHAPMHSVSVGDVLEVNGGGFMVKSMGFEAVEGW
jgi:hypothetical protein